MKNILYLTILLSAILSSCNSPKDNGWYSLFNGKDFTGWRQLNGRAIYEIVDGVIVGTTVEDTPNSFLVTEKTYGDFILELDLLLEDRMNSGIQFRSLSKPDYKQGRVHGYQCEVDPSSRKWSGGIYDEARRGWLYPLTLNPEAGDAFKLNGWNHYRIECIGNTIQTWLNGVPVACLVDNMTSEGFIALQIHSVGKGQGGKHIRWRDIRIKTENLKMSKPAPIFIMNNVEGNITEAEKENGWKWLGADAWQGDMGNRWEIGNDVLSVSGQGKNKQDLISKERYNSFDLQWKFKLAEGASSGLLYLANPASGFPGLEFQLRDDDNEVADTIATHSLASLYGYKAAKLRSRFVRPAGEWNMARLVVSPDRKVGHWVNGIKALEYSLDSEDLKAAFPISNLKGGIVLKDEGSQVSFRDFKIKRLQ